jgi:hypothetical protein
VLAEVSNDAKVVSLRQLVNERLVYAFGVVHGLDSIHILAPWMQPRISCEDFSFRLNGNLRRGKGAKQAQRKRERHSCCNAACRDYSNTRRHS